ncbi:MAG: ArsR/SmtB family transcription factor [Saprospiraceae bacterium]
MGASKSDQFSTQHNEIATMAKALAHPARIAILEYLLTVPSCICGDIVNELPLAQPTISQHLKEMKNAGLIKGTVEGTSICYCVDDKNISKLQHYFKNIVEKIDFKTNKCC